MPTEAQGLIRTLLGRFGSRLRFPQLFALAAGLFLLDLLIPDLIPFLDEILLGLATVWLGSLEKPKAREPDDKPPMKDITPPEERT